jgi:hypothetical protein
MLVIAGLGMGMAMRMLMRVSVSMALCSVLVCMTMFMFVLMRPSHNSSLENQWNFQRLSSNTSSTQVACISLSLLGL